jgi:hypothetical protein
MPDYSKWDTFVDSSDDDEAAKPAITPAAPVVPGPSGPSQQATVKASFIVLTECTLDKKKLYINICSSNSVAHGMSTTPSDARGLHASLSYIVGDARTDDDGDGECYVVECLFHPETIAHADNNKQAAEAVIHTALNVVSDLSVPCAKNSWSLFEHARLREHDGTYFFAPGKLADDDLSGIE